MSEQAPGSASTPVIEKRLDDLDDHLEDHGENPQPLLGVGCLLSFVRSIPG
jgi:hypothetical protein